MSIGDGTATGMYQTVDEIFADTAAAKAGVEKDDVVLAVYGARFSTKHCTRVTLSFTPLLRLKRACV
jgi:hypothetical protein